MIGTELNPCQAPFNSALIHPFSSGFEHAGKTAKPDGTDSKGEFGKAKPDHTDSKGFLFCCFEHRGQSRPDSAAFSISSIINVLGEKKRLDPDESGPFQMLVRTARF